MDLYFKRRHDGQAATCEDFFTSMQDPNDANFQNFLLCRNVCSFNYVYDLSFSSQEVPPTTGQQVKVPMFIPLAVGLLDSNGKDIPLMSMYHEGLLESLTTNGHPVDIVVLQVKNVSSDCLSMRNCVRI
ncbi:hypothetical protein IFM89_009698 [Coptis chinensis]|uniref:Peptidase M1 alanyl aminopeptidase Ig-like fold domain-containing protein n=1 Tax=Coptis chinensis TaxID=261450 RepID=A0A835HU08_9MAGN|nr:hypothetical protein IFM89_009698 [Coptis chinensis]